jgi:mannosyl-3-phosphoglycerate phosphatase family protein
VSKVGNAIYLIATDLDGSLLDHDDYSCEPAKPLLQLLEEMRIPVVFASSKTRAEMLELRAELGNEHPFIVENGAAVLIPQHYFLRTPADVELRDGFWVHELAPPRSHWQPPLDRLRRRFPGVFVDFASAGVEGIAEMTGLPRAKAALANEREYSEPVQWCGSEAQLTEFLAALAVEGAKVLKGGRFYSVAGDCDKGRALLWLRQQYRLAADASTVYDLAIGDGGNDVPMLEVAHQALQIPAHDRPLPALERQSGVIVGQGYGPGAWAWGVQEWLRGLYQPPEEE